MDCPNNAKFKNPKQFITSNYKPKHTSIAPEDIDVNAIYSLTINPKNQFEDVRNSRFKTRASDVMKVWNVLLELDSKDTFSCVLYIESKNGRVHFHGVLQIHDPLRFDIFVLPRWQGACTYEIDTIGDLEVWYKYCKKQQHLWKDAGQETTLIKVGSHKQCKLVKKRVGKLHVSEMEKGIFKMEEEATDLSPTGTCAE